jgi:hypothetical protein
MVGTAGANPYNPVLEVAYYLTGHVSGASSVIGLMVTVTSRTTDASISAITDTTGSFRVMVPSDNYFINVQSGSTVVWTEIFVFQAISVDLPLLQGVTISGKVWYDTDADGVLDASEGRSGVSVYVSDIDGRAAFATTASDGSYTIPVLAARTYTLSVNEPGFESYSTTYAPLDVSVTQNVQLLAINRTIEGARPIWGPAPGTQYPSRPQAGQWWLPPSSPAPMGPTRALTLPTTPDETHIRLERHEIPILGAFDLVINSDSITLNIEAKSACSSLQ